MGDQVGACRSTSTARPPETGGKVLTGTLVAVLTACIVKTWTAPGLAEALRDRFEMVKASLLALGDEHVDEDPAVLYRVQTDRP